jgi:hypothetical protein
MDIQLFALVTPLFFQIVIDKVLVHKAMSTLTVIVIGLAAIGLEPQIALDTKLFLVRIDQIAAIRSGDQNLYIFGWARYFDGIPRTPERVTKFC